MSGPVPADLWEHAMTQLPDETGSRFGSDSSTNNVYTALALVAVIMLLGALGYIWLRSQELFGSGTPFQIADESPPRRRAPVRSAPRAAPVSARSAPEAPDAEVAPEESPEQAEPAEPPQTSGPAEPGSAAGFVTPQAAFTAMQEALASRNWAQAVNCMSADTQDQMAGGLLVLAGVMSMDPQQAPAVQAVLKKHGVDMDAEPGDDFPVADKAAFIADVIAVMGPEQEEMTLIGTLQDLQVDGLTASGQVVSPDGRQEPALFVKENGRWFVAIPQDAVGGLSF